MPPSRPSDARRWFVALAVFAACFWTFDLAVLRAGVPDPNDDTWEYGVVARHIAAGRGWRTTVIHPPLWTLRDRDGSVPVLIHGPLVPLLLLPGLRAHDPEGLDGTAWRSALFALAGALLVFRIAARRFGGAVGFAAGALFTLAPHLMRAVHHDPAIVVGACLLALAIDRLEGARPDPIGAGLALGLADLARPEMLAALPALLVLAPPRGRWTLAGVFAACVAPWWWHDVRATGSPLFNLSSYLTLGYTPARPGLSVLRDFQLTPEAWPGVFRRALATLPSKWIVTGPSALLHLLTLPTLGTGWLVPLGALAAFTRPDLRRLAIVFLLLALVPLAVMTLTLVDPRYLVPFLAPWAIGAAVGMETLVHRLPRWLQRPRAALGLLLLLALPSVAPAIKQGQLEARTLERELRADRADLRARFGAPGAGSALVFSDHPDFVSWSTGRPSVWITIDEYQALPEAGPTSAQGGALVPARSAADATWFRDPPAAYPTRVAPD